MLKHIIHCQSFHFQGLPESVCLCFTRELLQILKILHECKIIHGDFKADNIIVKSL